MTRVFHFIRNVIFNERIEIIIVNERNITQISRKIIKRFTLYTFVQLLHCSNLKKERVGKSNIRIIINHAMKVY